MIREKAKEAAEVMMTYADGKKIEFRESDDKIWNLFSNNKKDRFLCFNFDRFEYRIKKAGDLI